MWTGLEAAVADLNSWIWVADGSSVVDNYVNFHPVEPNYFGGVGPYCGGMFPWGHPNHGTKAPGSWFDTFCGGGDRPPGCVACMAELAGQAAGGEFSRVSSLHFEFTVINE